MGALVAIVLYNGNVCMPAPRSYKTNPIATTQIIDRHMTNARASELLSELPG